jgi:hypothetical protein
VSSGARDAPRALGCDTEKVYNGGAQWMTNTIVSHLGAGISNTAPASSTVRANYTLFYSNGTNYGVGVVATNNRSGNPSFLDPAAWNYHIGAASKAKNAGTNAGITKDIDGDARPYGATYDIGADEARWPHDQYLPLVR